MNMRRIKKTNLFWALIAPLLISCSDGGSNIAGDGELVTVSGVVYNVDGFNAPAEGVVVYLLDNKENYKSEPTGENGEYSLKVPAGSTFVLTTDDADDSLAGPGGTWYPTINVDSNVTPTIDEDISAWPVHVCPSLSVSTGSMAALENFFQNSTIADGFFPVNSLNEDNGGLIAGNYLNLNSSTFTFVDSPNTVFEINDEDYVEGYLRDEGAVCESGFVCPDVGPELFLPKDTTASGNFSAIYAFGPASKGDKTVKMTVSSPGFDMNPVEIPVRKNTMSLTWSLVIDGQANKTIKDFLNTFGVGL